MSFKLLVICTVAVAVSLAQKTPTPTKIPVSTRYITTAISRPNPNQNVTYVATLCKKFAGYRVNATILLNNNPNWNPNVGVVYYYIVDAPDKTEKDALCVNIDKKTGARGPSCMISKWVSKAGGDLYLKTTAGDVAGINFSIDVELNPGIRGTQWTKVMKEPLAKIPRGAKFYPTQDVEYLTEIATVAINQNLTYLDTALLDITFCPNKLTTDHYEISSTVFATDGISSYTQYVCDKLPCTTETGQHIKSNPQEVPINNVYLTTASAEYTHIYVLIVCWAGELNQARTAFVGQFQYGGTITALP